MCKNNYPFHGATHVNSLAHTALQTTDLIECVVIIVTLFLLGTKLPPQLSNGCAHLTHSHTWIACFHFVPHLSIHSTLSCKQQNKTKRRCMWLAGTRCNNTTTDIYAIHNKLHATQSIPYHASTKWVTLAVFLLSYHKILYIELYKLTQNSLYIN